jgi:ParB family chromosome partitioning protein
MVTKRSSLGRGLGALLGQNTATTVTTPPATDISSVPPVAATGGRDGDLAKLPIDLLQRGKYQPRIDMQQESLQELAESIKVQGIIQPIVVRPLGERTAGQPLRYEIIAGERRWRAAQLAGLHEVPALIRHIPDEAAIAMALIENIQRENLNPLEEAKALARLISEFDMTHQTAAEAVGRSRAAVSNLLRLLDLADEVKHMLEKDELEMGHARALLGLSSARRQVEVGALVAKKGLSVRDTEALVRRMEKNELEPVAPPARPDPDIKRLESELAEKLGAKVQLQHNGKGSGKLVISYNSLDELDGILGHMQ